MSSRAPLTPVPGLARTASLPPPPPRRAAGTLPDSTDDVTDVDSATAAAGQAPRLTPVQARPAASASAQVTRSITLSLPAQIVRHLKERARTERITQAEVLMDALLATRGQLTELLQHQQDQILSDGLFLRRASTRRSPSSDPLATLSLRMISGNVTTIDDLVTAHQAPSRSALCLAALKAYLAPSS